jgi:D-alanyl-lipoteichoic acid acyltransferase DltB (MBOAT superfamily)
VLFNSFWYLIFLPSVVLLYWRCPHALRTALLVIASYIFYLSWKPIYGLLILGMTLANYLVGLGMQRYEKQKKPILITGIVLNLGLLAYFKYAYFGWGIAQWASNGQLPDLALKIILPLGISFFAFEFIHYIVDVYKGSKPVRGFLDFALFASFFPTQIAGPIKRYQDFVPQLEAERQAKSKFNMTMLDDGLNEIVFGLFKKVVIADNLAPVVQQAFSHPELLTGTDLWLATYAFAFQIYFDFSGYTDIARGSARLLGFSVPPNFNLPYMATSITDFWRRWHMSLSSWLKDYLFIPLGGNRGKTSLFTWRNLLITMILGGLWHGAAMHFVVWGAYQGIMLILHKEFKSLTDRVPALVAAKQSPLGHALAIVVTFNLVCIGWVFFRAETMESATAIVRKLLFIEPAQSLASQLSLTIVNTPDNILYLVLPIVVALLFAGQLIAFVQQKRPFAVPRSIQAVYMATLICLLLLFSPDTSPKFIYFQF